MAVTSVWSVKGWLGKIIRYVENPDKTENLSHVIAYAVNAEKTRREGDGQGPDEEGEIAQYVTGVNCTPVTARMEMTAVKKRFGKEEGVSAYHGYQSFAPGECTPAMAHEIGVKLAKELWGSRFQVLVATHLDKAHHLHNHFVVNSVSFADGKRYHRTKQDYRDMQEISDRLCRAYSLSVIEAPENGRTKHYGEWQAEKEGKPTYRSMMKADVDEAIREAGTERQFFRILREKGYDIKIGKDITLCQRGRDRGLKLKRNFGEEYGMDAIRKRLLSEKDSASPVYKGLKEPDKRRREYRILRDPGRLKKRGGLRRLYIYYCYQLGILPKGRPPVSSRELHVIFRDDLRKLDTISKETRLLCHYRIDTAEQLSTLREKLKGCMEELTGERTHLRYKSRNIKDQKSLEEIRAEITGLTGQIRALREEVRLCDGIAGRSGLTEEKFRVLEQEKESRRKEERKYEYIRRGR